MKVVLVHRWDGTPEYDWYPWLKQRLEHKGFEVVVPSMPNTAEPEITAWVNHLKKVVGVPARHTYFIGHSIGCQTIMRYLETLPKHIRIGGAIFVAGWFVLENLENDDVTAIVRPWVETPIDFTKIKEKTTKISVFLSDNDPFGGFKNAPLFKKHLNAKVIQEKGRGHFTAEDGVTELPEVIEELNKFLQTA